MISFKNLINKNAMSNGLAALALGKGAYIHGADFSRNGGVVVLAEWRGEFVTWKYGNEGFFWGHYYTDDAQSALADFMKRVAE